MRIKALYRSRILPVFFLALCGSVFAQTLSLSVDDAVRLALENNSSVQRERLAESVARARSAASWNAFLPDISLSAALRNVHELAGLDDTVRPDPTGTDLSASAGIRLSLQAGVGETLRQTELEKNRAEIVRTDAEASVVRAVKTSYYAIATEQRRLELYGKNLELAQREAAMVQKNYNAGLAIEEKEPWLPDIPA